MNSKINSKKKKVGRPPVIKNGRNVNLYLGAKHYNFAKSQDRPMSEFIRSLIEREIIKQQRVTQGTTL